MRATCFIGTATGFRDFDAVGPDVLPEDEIKRIVIPDEEIVAHNVVLIGDSLFVPSGNPVSVGLLREAGEKVVEVDFDQFTRADAGLTCLMGFVYWLSCTTRMAAWRAAERCVAVRIAMHR